MSGRGVQEPAVVVYRDGEVHAFHALDDAPPDAFAASVARGVGHFRGDVDEMRMDGADARAVLASLLAALESAKRGVPVDLG